MFFFTLIPTHAISNKRLSVVKLGNLGRPESKKDTPACNPIIVQKY